MAKQKCGTRVQAHPQTGKKTVHVSRATGKFVKGGKAKGR